VIVHLFISFFYGLFFFGNFLLRSHTMGLKHFCHFFLSGALLATGLSAHAESPYPVETGIISPASGILFDGQSFDLVIQAPTVSFPVGMPPNFLSQSLTVTASIDGADVSPWLKACLKPVSASEVAPTNLAFVCAGQSGSVFKTPGLHHLSVELAFLHGPVIQAEAQYRVIKSLPSLLAPFEFTVQSNKLLNPTKLLVNPTDRLRVTATGWVSTWPSNGARLLGPRGASTPCNSLCLYPYASAGALLVKIGETGKWRPVGDASDLWVDYPGEVIFAVNDNNSSPVNWSDNVGSFQVVITRY
jgi:hypothetical protein